MMDFNLWCD